MRDSESIFDQVVAYSGSSLTYETVREVLHIVDQDTFFRVTDLILTSDTRGGFLLADEVVMSGYDTQDFLAGLEEHYRNLLVVRSTGETRLIEAPEEMRNRYAAVAERFSEGDLLRLLRMTSNAMQALRFSAQPRLRFEVTLIDMIKLDSTVEISTLLSGMSGGPVTTAAVPQRSATAAGTNPQRSVASSGIASTGTVATSVVKEQLRSAERSYKQALDAFGGSTPSQTSIPPPSTVGSAVSVSAMQAPAATPVPAPAIQDIPTHPIVQMLIDGLDAVVLPGTK
jgi:DNA polymerase-3 subunit gamma/tau